LAPRDRPRSARSLAAAGAARRRHTPHNKCANRRARTMTSPSPSALPDIALPSAEQALTLALARRFRGLLIVTKNRFGLAPCGRRPPLGFIACALRCIVAITSFI